MTTVTIRGSHGNLTVDRATGFIVELDDRSEDDTGGYADILFVLPETLAPGHDACLDKHGETDILDVGYVTDTGFVVPPMSRILDANGFHIHEDLLALPAPDCTLSGLHSWIDETGRLPADAECARCGELYGDPS